VKREKVKGKRGKTNPTSFAQRLLEWSDVHGRHDLPWQMDRSDYRVWLSEIMLQQTQVGTVIDYFQRFTARFPDLDSLAKADLDEVMALWSGLGYYARARNLHKTARICVESHGGRLPDSAEELQQLPGIGRSTANAIVAQAHDQRAVILDGNVKRVVARHAAIEGWPGRSAIARVLWKEAEIRTPPDRARDYTQAIMDLGSGICRPRQPACQQCPVGSDCMALRKGLVTELPGKRPRRTRPEKTTTLLLIEDDQGRLLLKRRPPTGVWGGLWCLPEISHPDSDPDKKPVEPLLTLRHDFTHFRLHIRLVRSGLNEASIEEGEHHAWMKYDQALATGLPRPVRTMLEALS